MDWLVGLGAAGAAGSAVSGGATVGNAVTSSSARTGSTFGAAAGLTSGVGMGGLAAANLVYSSAAATAQAAATAAQTIATAAQTASTAAQTTALGAQTLNDTLQGAATAYATQQGLAAEAAIDAANQATQAAAEAQANANAAAAKAKNSKWVTPILDIANVMHMSLNLLNGFNAPNKGDSLDSAAKSLDSAALNLELAANTTGWESEEGEPAYTSANEAQQGRVKEMAKIDRDFKKALTTQADQVLKLREVFGYVTGSFAIWKPILGLLSTYGEAQKAASLITQGVVGTALLATDTSHQGIHHQKAVANSAAILGYAADYRNL